jgi:hypothetical protein
LDVGLETKLSGRQQGTDAVREGQAQAAVIIGIQMHPIGPTDGRGRAAIEGLQTLGACDAVERRRQLA